MEKLKKLAILGKKAICFLKGHHWSYDIENGPFQDAVKLVCIRCELEKEAEKSDTDKKNYHYQTYYKPT